MNTDADDPSNHDIIDESTGVIYTEPNDMDINDPELVGIQGYSDLLNFDQATIITESEQVMATQHIENAKITYEQNQKDNFNETELSALPVASVSLREDSTLPFVKVKNYTTRLASLERVIEHCNLMKNK